MESKLTTEVESSSARPLMASLSAGTFTQKSFSSSGYSIIVRLSEFLLKGCSPWREAPPCADYIGPVKVARTPDGRGRRLFATQDVRAGTLLLISNPMAMSYDDPHRVLLLMRLVAHAQDDPLFLKQMYCLAHTQSSQDEMEVPSMDFLASPPRSPSDYGTDVHVDPSRIMDIIMLNSFEGEFKDDNQESKTWFCGLYLIASLINHSCHRNASRLIVRGTMILHAATDIQKGEEITITYISTVAPLELRHKSSLAMKFGFKCKCKGCIVEDSLRHSLSDVSEMYCNLHDKAFDEVRKAISLVSHRPTESSFSVVAQFRSIFDRVSSRIRSEYGLSEIERKWIMAGYSSAYLGKCLIRGYIARFSKKPAIWDDTIVEVVEALRTTIPGLPHTLSLITLIVAITQRLENKHEIGKDDVQCTRSTN
ncbi:hypothetical protein KP509_36G050700 [Ceratopteris richardii]|uniref:SET domain-containing protein n=1 Tax=Ceratopteris richardii TaxID=49495 RepID=A0A8T2QCT7_CERRI|nr:hypothetical protein KP509_36G050700 [Ceratopteris richardii]